MKRKLLMIDDDYQLSQVIKTKLFDEVELTHTFYAQDASKAIAKQLFSIVIFKFHLSEAISDFDFLHDLRLTRPMPIIVRGAASCEERTRAYDMGADVCLSQTDDHREVIAAIKAALRRYYQLNIRSQLEDVEISIRYKSLEIFPLQHIVFLQGREIVLTNKEYKILILLAGNPGIAFAKERIYETIWREDSDYGAHCVLDHISSLRQKLSLGEDSEDYIQTVRGFGYRFAAI